MRDRLLDSVPEFLRRDLRGDLDPETAVTLMTAALGGIAYQYLLDETLDLDALYGGLEQLLVRGLAPDGRDGIP